MACGSSLIPRRPWSLWDKRQRPHAEAPAGRAKARTTRKARHPSNVASSLSVKASAGLPDNR